MKADVLLYFASADDDFLAPKMSRLRPIRFREENMLEGCRFLLGAARAAGREAAGSESDSPWLNAHEWGERRRPRALILTLRSGVDPQRTDRDRRCRYSRAFLQERACFFRR